jgi:hypothetical protein
MMRVKKHSSASQKTVSNPNLGEADPGGLGRAPRRTLYVAFFFFQKKKQKALVLLRRRLSPTQISAKPTLGVWGRAPRRTLYVVFFFFQKKKQKALVFARREDLDEM